jgi:hypothetical protein
MHLPESHSAMRSIKIAWAILALLPSQLVTALSRVNRAQMKGVINRLKGCFL